MAKPDFKALRKEREIARTSGRAFVQILNADEASDYCDKNNQPMLVAEKLKPLQLAVTVLDATVLGQTAKSEKTGLVYDRIQARVLHESTGQVSTIWFIQETGTPLFTAGTVIKSTFVKVEKGQIIYGTSGAGDEAEDQGILALKDCYQYVQGSAFEISGKELIALAIANSSFSQAATAVKEK